MANFRRKTMSSGCGVYSLAEALIASVVLVIVLVAIYMVYETGSRDAARGTARADVQQNVRVALESMARELRIAGYNPPGSNCAAPPAGAVTALSSSPVSVTFQADVDGNGCTDRIVYAFVPPTDPTNPCDSASPATIGRITRSAQEWNDTTGWTPASPTAYDVAQCVTTLTVTYYTETGAATTTAADVRRIGISITGRENIRGWGARTYTLTSDVRLRNL